MNSPLKRGSFFECEAKLRGVFKFNKVFQLKPRNPLLLIFIKIYFQNTR